MSPTLQFIMMNLSSPASHLYHYSLLQETSHCKQAQSWPCLVLFWEQNQLVSSSGWSILPFKRIIVVGKVQVLSLSVKPRIPDVYFIFPYFADVCWFHAGDVLKESPSCLLSQTGNNHHLAMFNMSREQAGQYSLAVVNSQGEVWHSFNVGVTGLFCKTLSSNHIVV